uniref:doubled motif LPXTG anchor domain-containing protein n=2 Tax=Enterocloster clostridioformis TaxID=1531 RepID=UPI00266F5688|nr:doubled motif LPXTG anchor domain-containing protein [Enterocloster clostridioformis]
MEGRKRSGMLKKSVYNMRKRLVAFALAAAMVCTNVGADLNAAYGATSSSESVTFEMTGSQLVTAIEEAIENGNVISPGDLDFTNGDIAKFESLFYGEGKVLEVYPDPDGGSMDAELRVFVRLPEDADDMYMVTGDEEIIFLYVNNGEDTISCSTNITRMENGVEKVKKTKRITVKSFEAAYGDEEINYISKPVEETTATAPEDVNGPGTEETIAPDTTVPTVEGTVDETTTVVPGESESTDAPREEQTTAPEEGSTAPTEGVTETSTEAAATEEATTEEATDAPETTEEKTQEAAEADAPEPEAAEPEAATGEPVASIIRHYAPVVADNEEGNAEEAPKVEEAKEPEAEPEEKTEAVKETEAPTEKETEPVAPAETESTTEAQEGNQEESPAAASDETTAEAGESTDPSETTTEGTTAAPSEGDETTTPETTTDAAETPAATEEVQVGTPSDVTKPEVKPEETVNKASTTDLVGMGYCSTAKVYTTTINQLKALDDFDGYKITYSINPGASARIVDGARGVEEGESLTFGVKNQIGFAVESVTANGEVLEADSIADNEDGSQTAWYTVPEVYEEQEVEVYTVETDIHPAFDAELVMDDGMVIHIVAEEGVLPAGVRATAVRVNDNVETAVQEIISADTKRNVSSVMAYDINLWLGDKLLDAEMWSGSRLVNVTFTGKPIIEQSAEADVVEVVCVETVQDSNKEEKEKAAAQESEIAPEDIVKVETVSDTVDVPGEQTVGEISFEAEHFTIYAVVSGNKQYDSTTIAVGEKLTLYNENNKNTLLNADWSVTSGSDVISFISGSTQKRNSIEIVGLKPGTAMVRAASSWGRNYSYTIIVTDTSGINAEYWITNREVTGSDGQQSKNISSTDLSQYGDNGVPVDEVAPSTGTRENDELIFWHARVLPANYHQTNNAGINRVENGQRIERLRFFNENIQYYTSSGSWKDFAATDQLVFYYLQRTELAKQVEIAVSDWWENSNDNTRKIEYELIDELSGNSMGSSLTSYHDKHPGVSGIYITPNLDNAYSVSKVTVDNVEINWENGFSVGWTKSSQTVTVRIYIKPNEANLQIQYLTEDGQPLTGELESSTLGVLTREGTDFNGYVRNGNLQNTKIEGYYGETYIIYTDLKSVSSLKEYALNYEYSSAAVSDNNTVLKLYYRSVSHEYTVNYYKDSISDRNFLGEVEGTGSVGDTIPADLTLFAPEGYAVPGTRSGAEKISADGGDVVNVVYSKKTNLSYTVNYYKDSIEEGNYLDKVEGTGTFGDAIPADLTKFAPAGYAVPGARSGAEKISADGGDVVNVVYSKDTFKYSVHYFYDEVEDEQALEQGIGEFESQVTTYKVKPRTKYALDYVENLPLTIGTDVSKNVINVYYALDDNEDEIPDKYQILFTYVSAGNGSVDGEIKEVHTFRDDNDNYIKPTPTSPKANITVNADDKYAFDYWTVDGSSKDYHINMDTFKTNTYLENTTFTVYFDKDEIGTNLENPDNPDGIPDKYQVVFEYRSEDTNRGTVYGTVKEVVTRPQNEDGSYNMEAPVYPSANVTVSGIGSYSFNNWTDGSRSYANADEIKAAGFTQSTTFTAQFNYNGGGGGTGGGGGGTSGGTTGNRRYTSTPGGPGFTTITPEDVPLAPLPESPVDVTLIDDGEVPLAPLPKTGQTSMRTTLTMMLSGIFVAVTALSRKRKEEDS